MLKFFDMTSITMPHIIEIFSASCPLCDTVIRDIEKGKCPKCTHIVYDVSKRTDEIKQKMEKYGIQGVPTTIMDGKYKIVGVSNFTWRCGRELDKKLEKEFSIK